MTYVANGPPHWPHGRQDPPARDRDALVAAQLLQALVRARRELLDEFLDGDGPYWISIGLFIDGETQIETPLERILEFADESIETGRYLLQRMMDRRIVQSYRTDAGDMAYRLSTPFAMQFRQYLDQQTPYIRKAQQRLAG